MADLFASLNYAGRLHLRPIRIIRDQEPKTSGQRKRLPGQYPTRVCLRCSRRTRRVDAVCSSCIRSRDYDAPDPDPEREARIQAHMRRVAREEAEIARRMVGPDPARAAENARKRQRRRERCAAKSP